MLAYAIMILYSPIYKELVKIISNDTEIGMHAALFS